jgi:hypothetical protein
VRSSAEVGAKYVSGMRKMEGRQALTSGERTSKATHVVSIGVEEGDSSIEAHL